MKINKEKALNICKKYIQYVHAYRESLLKQEVDKVHNGWFRRTFQKKQTWEETKAKVNTYSVCFGDVINIPVWAIAYGANLCEAQNLVSSLSLSDEIDVDLPPSLVAKLAKWNEVC